MNMSQRMSPSTLAFCGHANRHFHVQRGAYGLRDEEYLRLKVLTCLPPKL